MHKSMAVAIGLACGLVGSTISASAQEGVAMKNLMGSIGLIPQEKDPIRYRERAPLVIPPKTQLPAPSVSAAASNPQWPSDPDVNAKARDAELRRSPVTWSETRRMNSNNPRLTADEMRTGRSASNNAPIPGTHRGDNARDVLLLTPDQLRAGAKPDDDGQSGNELVRKTLTDPPSGIRRTASKNAGDAYSPRVDQQKLDANPMSWITSRFSGNSDDE